MQLPSDVHDRINHFLITNFHSLTFDAFTEILIYFERFFSCKWGDSLIGWLNSFYRSHQYFFTITTNEARFGYQRKKITVSNARNHALKNWPNCSVFHNKDLIVSFTEFATWNQYQLRFYKLHWIFFEKKVETNSWFSRWRRRSAQLSMFVKF